MSNPLDKPKKWQYTRAHDDDTIDRLLSEGWEPFAVTQPTAVTWVTIHFRKYA